MNEFLYLVRRETWEHKALYRAPIIAMLVLAAVSVLFVAKALIAGDIIMAAEDHLFGLEELVPQYLSEGSSIVMAGLFMVIFTVSTFVAAFYFLDCLYAERKNRSIMFWKSLPISDTATVVSKLVAAMVFLPLVSLAAVLVGWLFMQILGVVVLMLLGVNGLSLLWQPGVLFSGTWVALETSVGLLLWYLPLAGWLIMVSAWSKRSPFMWAVFPPLAIAFFEQLIFSSSHFVGMLGNRMFSFYSTIMDPDVFDNGFRDGSDGMLLNSLNDAVHLSSLFREPGLYGGIAVAAVFITAAIFLRRYRNES